MQDKKFSIFYLIYGFFAIFIIWFVAASFINQKDILPNVDVVFKELGMLLTRAYVHKLIFLMILKLLVVISICLFTATTLAIISTLSNNFRSFIRPLVSTTRVIPSASIILMLIFLVNNRFFIPIILAFTVIIPIMYEAIYNGLNSMPDELNDYLKLSTNINLKVVLKVHLPLSVDYIIMSLLQSLGHCFKVLLMGEIIVIPKKSIGNQMSGVEVQRILAWTIVLVFIVVLLDFVLFFAKKYYKKKINY